MVTKSKKQSYYKPHTNPLQTHYNSPTTHPNPPEGRELEYLKVYQTRVLQNSHGRL